MGTPASTPHHRTRRRRPETERKYVPCFVPYQLENMLRMGNMTFHSSRPYIVKMDVVTET